MTIEKYRDLRSERMFRSEQVAAIITVCSIAKLLHIVFKRRHCTVTHSQHLATNTQFQPLFHICYDWHTQ